MHDTFEVTVGPEGRVLVPAPLRRAVDMEPGSRVVLRLEGDHLVLMTRDAVARRLRAMFADVAGSMADELMAERRTEVERDAGEP